MIIKLQPAAGAKLVVHTKDGKKFNNDQIESVEFEPFFSMANAQGEIASGTVVNAQHIEVDKFVLQASGQNGKLSRRNRVEQSVIPQIDKPKAAKTATPATGAKP